MLIDYNKCTGCKQCVVYCPMGAIKVMDNKALINQDRCTECGVCYRVEVCKTNAIYEPVLEWPRAIRAQFSNPLFTHRSIKIEGRGTEEMKTNDITNRFKIDKVGIGIELGRPGVGTNFDDFEKISKSLAKTGVEFALDNPTTHLIDTKTGCLLEKFEDVRWEFVTSAIIECITDTEKLEEIILVLKGLENSINTVCSLGLIFRDTENYRRIIDKLPVNIRFNAKINVGMALA